MADLAGMLGVKPRRAASPLYLIRKIQDGLPVSALDRIARQIAPDDPAFRYRIVPRSSLARRRQHGRLSPEEGARLARLANLWSFACDVWKREEDARAFLFRRHMLLEDRRPIDVVIESDLGAELVRRILGQLLYGTAL